VAAASAATPRHCVHSAAMATDEQTDRQTDGHRRCIKPATAWLNNKSHTHTHTHRFNSLFTVNRALLIFLLYLFRSVHPLRTSNNLHNKLTKTSMASLCSPPFSHPKPLTSDFKTAMPVTPNIANLSSSLNVVWFLAKCLAYGMSRLSIVCNAVAP